MAGWAEETKEVVSRARAGHPSQKLWFGSMFPKHGRAPLMGRERVSGGDPLNLKYSKCAGECINGVVYPHSRTLLSKQKAHPVDTRQVRMKLRNIK